MQSLRILKNRVCIQQLERNYTVSDTPRTDDAELGYGKVTTDFARQLERELNEANVKIKWLQEAFDAAEGLIAVSSCGCSYGDEVFHCSSCVQAINRYHKAKEIKP